ncbi:Rossmann-fold NAD(P)-binding domain-containing protein [Parasedimentitalea psychrophila]|uniref:DUF4829 domain-containing protein n=1 Tax=Parasedimentitalea psychrophila TaxID=2997337 RepID=A0A9Y2P5E5_9RHOB|nr:hypothetical protein [Parasedimentitalea psychrophila]WIY23898.1 hypothetical protein QPJ95_14785 [Parasedimentitalea psychrophila]
MKFKLFLPCLVWAFSLAAVLPPSWALADYVAFNGSEVAPNIAEFRIDEDGVHVQLEVYVGDLKTFDALVPNSWFKDDAPLRATSDDRIVDFTENGLSIRRSDGTALPIAVQLIERRMRVDRASPLTGQRDPATGKVFPAPPDDPRVLYAELFYPFNGTRPDRLVFTPPLDADGNAQVSIGMVVFDRDVPVIDFRYLAKRVTLNIEWLDPWYTSFENPNLARHYRFPMMSFLYASPFEIRHEALIRVHNAAELVGVEIAGRTMTKAERREIESRLPSVLNDRSPMAIDGKKIIPTFDRLSFMRIGTRGLNFIQEEDEVRADADYVGLIYSTPTAGYAQEATVEWTVFPDPVTKVPGNAIDAAGPFLAGLTSENPILKWTNYFKTYEPPVISPVVFGKERTLNVPMLTILLIVSTLCGAVFLFRRQSIPRIVRITALGTLLVATAVSTQIGWINMENPIASTPDRPAAARIASQLIENFHNALQEKIPERLNEALRTSVSADAFEDVKLELGRALIVEMQGGGAGSIKNIRDFGVANIRPTPSASGFQASVSWSVTATGEHWGHPHQKNIRFSAVMDIAPIEGAWKLTGMTVTSAQPEI